MLERPVRELRSKNYFLKKKDDRRLTGYFPKQQAKLVVRIKRRRGKGKPCSTKWIRLFPLKPTVRQVKLNRCLRPTFFTVNQNIGCRFICVCRGDTRQRAFESPDPGECFTYPHDGCKVSRKFSRDA